VAGVTVACALAVPVAVVEGAVPAVAGATTQAVAGT
jgi:hypothetical protein